MASNSPSGVSILVLPRIVVYASRAWIIMRIAALGRMQCTCCYIGLKRVVSCEKAYAAARRSEGEKGVGGEPGALGESAIGAEVDSGAPRRCDWNAVLGAFANLTPVPQPAGGGVLRFPSGHFTFAFSSPKAQVYLIPLSTCILHSNPNPPFTLSKTISPTHILVIS